MSAYWLTYKPLNASSPRGWPAAEMSGLVSAFNSNPSTATPLWRIASHQRARTGDRVFLFKQGSGPRGIFGVGEIIEPPRHRLDPTDIAEGLEYRVRISLSRLVDPSLEFLLDYPSIQKIVPESLINAQASGASVSGEVENKLDDLLGLSLAGSVSISGEQADDPGFDPDSLYDERERAFRAIRVRRGQPGFRAELLDTYGGRCAISGCGVKDVLDAAHIVAYRGPLTNHVSNGLLLRTDLHTLFDCDMIAIDPANRTVMVARALDGSSYSKIAGKKLRQPNDETRGPSRRLLEKRFRIFEQTQASRREKINVSS